MADLDSSESREEAKKEGDLFTWGRGGSGQLGQSEYLFPGVNCALPHPVKIPGNRKVVKVAVGGGDVGYTAALTSDGALFTFGGNSKGRLGHGLGPAVNSPRRVESLSHIVIIDIACGYEHMLVVNSDRNVFSWGGDACILGRDFFPEESPQIPGLVLNKKNGLPVSSVTAIDCEWNYSAIISASTLYIWGKNTKHGRLGVGDTKDRRFPTKITLDPFDEHEDRPMGVGLGSLYAGAWTQGGHGYIWGYGGHGNLGLGDRSSHSKPQLVSKLTELGEHVVQLACTRGQSGCKGGLLKPTSPSVVAGKGGFEGPHTIAICSSGNQWTWGTCHKGLVGNLGSKTGAFGQPWDELVPYRFGDPVVNGTENPPLSPLGLWPPPYDKIGPFVAATSAHIHCTCLTASGKAWAWGCGSNDGRCGVERFLNMSGEGKPPKIDSMKCYMMNPHPIGIARKSYWKGGPSLSNMKVLQLASGRNHMAAIAVEEN